MTGVLRELPARDPEPIDSEIIAKAGDHPMRIVTRAVAAEVGSWDPTTARDVRELFDGLAPEWHTRFVPSRPAAVLDALERGGTFDCAGWCLELGSGDGSLTPTMAERFPRLVSIDLSFAMLQLGSGVRVQADAAALPLADHSIATAVLVNMLLFPNELDRVLALDGALVWVSSRSEATPIYLDPEDVAAALPGRWKGVRSRSGPATWAVLQRA